MFRMVHLIPVMLFG